MALLRQERFLQNPKQPPHRAIRDLFERLRELVGVFQQRYPHVVCSLSTSGHLSDVDAEIGAAICHVVRECLTNIAYHAKAHFVIVEVALFRADPGVAVPACTTLPPAMLRVTISDDGIGFHVRAATEGFGLTHIRERIAALGGIYDIDSQPGRGTSISVEVPLPAMLTLVRADTPEPDVGSTGSSAKRQARGGAGRRRQPGPRRPLLP
jgi:signal transduction histidine kinase